MGETRPVPRRESPWGMLEVDNVRLIVATIELKMLSKWGRGEYKIISTPASPPTTDLVFVTIPTPPPAKLLPILTQLGSKPLIVIASHSLAHQALIDNSVIFADRPQAMAIDKFLSCDQHNISSAFYSLTWLRLCRNLTYNMLHTLRIKSFACARKWALDALINHLKFHSSSYEYHHTKIREPIQYALYYLFTFICFGKKLKDKKIQDIKDLQRRLQLSFDEFKVVNLFPSLRKFIFLKRWEKLRQL
ncbi:cytochrome P450 89A9-like [Gossypium hirsutum]|uniref:Cytochrome P450 89A9-like n=1 Tax=Gossypium hirsutum TaxID=3635 RepID=A0ABM2ZT12_GOSHI|nr:cytochrome P450 89A9-like [Gossypium hirsutum]